MTIRNLTLCYACDATATGTREHHDRPHPAPACDRHRTHALPAHAREGERCVYRGVAHYDGRIIRVHRSWVTVRFQLRYQEGTEAWSERRVPPHLVWVYRQGCPGPLTRLDKCAGH